MKQSLKIGTRPSRLAIKQVEEIQNRLTEFVFEIVTVKTRGDIDKVTPISQTEGTDFFTREIETALLNGQIDAAVHSAKDLEKDMPEGLAIAAITKSISPYECLVSRGTIRLEDLPSAAVVGTSSQKRKDALLRFRNDLLVRDIRGNIEERLVQLDKGDFDAIIVAHAALIRLGLQNRISQIIPPEIIEPHPLQGSLAVEVRSEDKELIRQMRTQLTEKIVDVSCLSEFEPPPLFVRVLDG